MDSSAMKKILLEYVDAFNSGDVQRLLALFAEDAVVEDPVGMEPKVGKEALAGFYSYAMGGGAKLELVAPPRGSFTNEATLSFIVHTAMERQAVDIHVTDVMTFDEQGKIEKMRAYWGQDDMCPVQ